MVVDTCSQERTYEKYYGLIGERLCKLNKIWAECFCDEFVNLVRVCVCIIVFETSH